jgi:thiamine pyrophosphate-dependent acetolactate synthase large subunit-like protein
LRRPPARLVSAKPFPPARSAAAACRTSTGCRTSRAGARGPRRAQGRARRRARARHVLRIRRHPGRARAAEDLVTLADPGEAADAALEALAEAVGATADVDGVRVARWNVEAGPLTPQTAGRVLADALPDDAIVSIEGGTCGYPFVTASARARRHTILTNTGGAIGQGLPVALGAAVACRRAACSRCNPTAARSTRSRRCGRWRASVCRS